MGINTNQIATRNNIQNGKRKYAYYNQGLDTQMKKCPTKGEINSIEFLNVKDISTVVSNESSYWNQGLASWSYGSMNLGPNNTPVISYTSGGIPITPSNYENYPLIITNESPGYYYHSSTENLFNISFFANISEDIKFNTLDEVETYSLCYKNISVTPGKYTNLSIDHIPFAYSYIRSISDNFSIAHISEPSENTSEDMKEFGITIAIADDNGEIIYKTDIDDYIGNLNYSNIYFTPTTSSITIYIIPRHIEMSFYPEIYGNLYVGVGFNLNIKKTIYNSYYDSPNKLAKYEDVVNDDSRTFSIYYGIWNDKNSTARLNYARVLINTTPDGSASGWTQIGDDVLSNITGTTKVGKITCKLPDHINLGTTQYYILVKVGDTLNNQDFSGGWGSTKEGTSYTYCRNSTSGWTPSIPLTPLTAGGDAVLNHININSTNYTEINSGIYNDNSNYRAWIRIQ